MATENKIAADKAQHAGDTARKIKDLKAKLALPMVATTAEGKALEAQEREACEVQIAILAWDTAAYLATGDHAKALDHAKRTVQQAADTHSKAKKAHSEAEKAVRAGKASDLATCALNLELAHAEWAQAQAAGRSLISVEGAKGDKIVSVMLATLDTLQGAGTASDRQLQRAVKLAATLALCGVSEAALKALAAVGKTDTAKLAARKLGPSFRRTAG